MRVISIDACYIGSRWKIDDVKITNMKYGMMRLNSQRDLTFQFEAVIGAPARLELVYSRGVGAGGEGYVIYLQHDWLP